MIYLNQGRKEKISRIAECYGLESQLNKTIEESAELIQAISKQKEISPDMNPSDVSKIVSNLAEEIADVWIMINQITELDEDLGKMIDYFIESKLDRQLERIAKEQQ